MRTKALMPVNTLVTRSDSRAPRVSAPVGKMEYESQNNKIHRDRTQTSGYQGLGVVGLGHMYGQ